MDIEWFQERKKARGGGDLAIAQIVGRERSVINKILSGKVGFDPKLADGFAEAFGVSRDEILYRAGITETPPPPAAQYDEPLFLQVSLPSAGSLTSMFEGMLELTNHPELAAELAPRLAQLLPGGLRRASVPSSDQLNEDEATLPGEGAPPLAKGHRGRLSPPYNG